MQILTIFHGERGLEASVVMRVVGFEPQVQLGPPRHVPQQLEAGAPVPAQPALVPSGGGRFPVQERALVGGGGFPNFEEVVTATVGQKSNILNLVAECY